MVVSSVFVNPPALRPPLAAQFACAQGPPPLLPGRPPPRSTPVHMTAAASPSGDKPHRSSRWRRLRGVALCLVVALRTAFPASAAPGELAPPAAPNSVSRPAEGARGGGGGGGGPQLVRARRPGAASAAAPRAPAAPRPRLATAPTLPSLRRRKPEPPKTRLQALRETAAEVRSHVTPAERDSFALLLAVALVTPLMGALNLSPVLGFLFAGIVLGPSGVGLISDVETTTKLAELGVVFFLFEMGLELELERLKSVGRDAFVLGSAQFGLTTALFAGLAKVVGGASASASVVCGGALALSSSAFVIQLLSEKGELASRFGRASFGILLFQDLAVVPLLVMTPLLGGTGAGLGAALRAAAVKSASALLILFAIGRLVLQARRAATPPPRLRAPPPARAPRARRLPLTMHAIFSRAV